MVAWAQRPRIVGGHGGPPHYFFQNGSVMLLFAATGAWRGSSMSTSSAMV